MATTALSCGNFEHATRPRGHGVRWVDVPATPGKDDVDPILADVSGRLLVRGTDADLAAVVVRLLRRNRLDLELGYVPVSASPASRLWGIPVADLDHALTAPARACPLIRDDVGGVLVGQGRVEPIVGQVYCDDERLLNGRGLRVEVVPDPQAQPLPEPTSDPLRTQPPVAMDGLRATAVRQRALLPRVWARRETARGRALQARFDESTVTNNGVAHPRPMTKWAWYRHTEDLWLVRS